MSEKSKPYHHGDLVQTLIAEAMIIIDERGVENLSLREAARRAGVSPGAPFRHFPSKAALLAAVAEQAMQSLHDAVRAAQDPGDEDPLRQLERIGMGYLDWARANPSHFRIISQRSAVELDGRALRLNDEIRTQMIELLARARAMGQLSPETDIDTALLSCRALVYGLARMFADGHFPEWLPGADPATWMNRSLTQFIRALRIDPPGAAPPCSRDG